MASPKFLPRTIIVLIALISSLNVANSKLFSTDELDHSSVINLIEWLKQNNVGGLSGTEPVVKVSIIEPEEPEIRTPSESSEDSQSLTDLELLAAKEISSGDEILNFHSDLLISARHAAKSSAPYAGAGDDMVLVAWLLTEKSKGKSSFWFPYIESLPKKWNHPIFWNESTLKNEMDLEPVIERVNYQKQVVVALYKKCIDEKIAFASLQEFTWAFVTVKSLEISVSVPEMDGSDSFDLKSFLLPLPDFRVLSKDPQVEWKGKLLNGELKIYSNQDLSPDDVIHFPYPPLESSSFLTDYGFFPSDNPFDKVILFPTLQSMVDFFLTNYTDKLKLELMERNVMRMAMAGVKEVKKEMRLLEMEGEEKSTVEFDFEDDVDEDFGIGLNGHSDPRMIVACACMASIIMEGGDISKKQLSKLAFYSIKLAKSDESFSCYELEREQDEVVLILRAGVDIIQAYIKQLVSSYKTSYMEDYAVLYPNSCEEKSEEASGKACKVSTALTTKELELAVKLRMSRKLMLLEFMSNLNRICEGLPYADDGEYDDDFGEYDEEELESMKGESRDEYRDGDGDGDGDGDDYGGYADDYTDMHIDNNDIPSTTDTYDKEL